MQDCVRIPISQIAQALYIINRNTKIDKRAGGLYALKKEVLEKLLQKDAAEKIGLQLYSYTEKRSATLTVLVQINTNTKTYYFHMLPTPIDLLQLPHIGRSSPELRNPKSYMTLSKARQVLDKFCGHKVKKQKKPVKVKKFHKGNVFKSRFLD